MKIQEKNEVATQVFLSILVWRETRSSRTSQFITLCLEFFKAYIEKRKYFHS